MRFQLNKNQNGAVALITVIFITILLTIITTSFVRMTIKEQREAIDDDLTTRAFYAAESGVEDAVRAIKTNVPVGNLHKEECRPPEGYSGELSSSNGLDTEYTCQLIDLDPDSYQSYLDKPGQTVFFQLKDAANSINNFKLQWHVYSLGNDGDGSSATARDSEELPAENAWGNHPAMLRLQVITVPKDNVTRNSLDNSNRVAFLNPGNGSNSTNKKTIDLLGSSGAGPLAVRCQYANPDKPNSGEYFCELNVTNLDDANNDYYLRITTLYKPTHIKVQAFGSTDSAPVSLVGAQAVIDVTGRANDVYRRVEKRVNLVNDSNLWPSFAILSAEDICKNFTITNEADSSNPAIVDFDNANTGISGSCVNNP